MNIAYHPHLPLQAVVSPRGLGLPLACGDWALFHFSFTVFPAMFVVTGRLIKLSGSEWGPIWVFMCNNGALLSPVLCECICVFACVHMHLTSPSSVPHSLHLPPPSASRRGLVWARTSAKLCGLDGQHHILCLVPERVPACTQSLFYYKASHWWQDREKQHLIKDSNIYLLPPGHLESKVCCFCPSKAL